MKHKLSTSQRAVQRVAHSDLDHSWPVLLQATWRHGDVGICCLNALCVCVCVCVLCVRIRAFMYVCVCMCAVCVLCVYACMYVLCTHAYTCVTISGKTDLQAEISELLCPRKQSMTKRLQQA